MHTELTTRARTELQLPNNEAMVWGKSATVQWLERMVMELACTNIAFLKSGAAPQVDDYLQY